MLLSVVMGAELVVKLLEVVVLPLPVSVLVVLGAELVLELLELVVLPLPVSVLVF